MKRMILISSLLLTTAFLYAEERVLVSIRTVFEMTSDMQTDSSEREEGENGKQPHSVNDYYDHTLDEEYISLAKKWDLVLYQYEDAKNAYKEILKNIPDGFPLRSKKVQLLTEFGGVIPDSDADLVHLGVDIGSDTEIATAIGKGIVDKIGYQLSGLGYYLYIYHGFGIYSIYGHLKKVHIKLGQFVDAGEAIGEIGNTGLAHQTCLHFSICHSQMGPSYKGRRIYFNPSLFVLKSTAN